MSDETYQGWKNYETWNVALYIDNERSIYDKSVKFMSSYKGKTPYVDFIKSAGLSGKKTPDDVKWSDPKIDTAELDSKLNEYLTDGTIKNSSKSEHWFYK